MQNPTIRPVHSDDLPVILEMAQALATHHGDTALLTLETLRRDVLSDPPWVWVLVAEREGVLVGYAALCPLAQLQFGARGMDMHHLFVTPSARRCGVGKALISGALDTARRMQADFVSVGTHPDNHAARKVYHAAGFEPIAPPGPRFRIRL